MSELNTKTLVSFGEALWDCVPRGLFLGGAPLNVAYHAAQIGMKALVATSVGRDFLGDEAVVRIERAGLSTDLVMRHPFLQTGVAIAELDESGSASYDLRMPVAWDDIEVDDSMEATIVKADVLVYGSLAARSHKNRERLNRLLEKAHGMKLCDVNLRAPYDDREIALELAGKADLVKVNDEELYRLLGVDEGSVKVEDAAVDLLKKLGCQRLCVTLGGEGAIGCEGTEVVRIETEPIEIEDTIGAGDSFTAALTCSLLEGRDLKESLRRATKLGSFVAGQSGAQPNYEAKDVLG